MTARSKESDRPRRDPRCARRIEFTEQEFALLGLAAGRLHTTRSALVRAATCGWLALYAAEERRRAEPAASGAGVPGPGAKAPAPAAARARGDAGPPRRTAEPRARRCRHPRATWEESRDRPPWCARCSSPVCPACRRRWRLWGQAQEAGDAVAIYEPGCGCQAGPWA